MGNSLNELASGKFLAIQTFNILKTASCSIQTLVVITQSLCDEVLETDQQGS